MTRRARLAAVAALALAATLPAPAASAQPDPGSRAKAELRFMQAQAFFKAGDYDHALAEYEAAFTLSREPLLVFNIALCHDRAGRPEQALEAFRRYLDLAPRGEVAHEARESVARLTQIVEKLRAKRAEEEARRNERARKARAELARARQAREAARRQAEERARGRLSVETEAGRLERRSRVERWSGIAALALGAVSLGLGTKYGLDARAAAADLSEHEGPWTDDILAREADGRSAQTRMIVFTGAGGAAILAGAALFLLGRHHDSRADRMHLEITPAAGGAAVSIGARF